MANKVVKTFDIRSGLSQTITLPGRVDSIRMDLYTRFSANQGIASNPGKMVIDDAGTLWWWGSNLQGQGGIGGTSSARSSPVVTQSEMTFVAAGNGNANAFALTVEGRAYAWGINTKGELGLGNIVDQSFPQLVVGGLSFKKLGSGISSAGTGVSVGLTMEGKAYGWGSNNNGAVGSGSVTFVSSPVAVVGGLYFRDIAVGNGHVLAISQDGSAAYAWGLNLNGQLGVNSVTPASSPVAVTGSLDFAEVACGGTSSFGITTSGAGYAWGNNSNGQLGLGDVTPRSSPVAIPGGLVFTMIRAASLHTIGLTSTGAAYCWGENGDGQLGNGANVTDSSSPTAVVGGLSFVAVDVGNNSCYGYTANGDLYAWGQNSGQELGIFQGAIPKSSPTLVVGGHRFIRGMLIFHSSHHISGLTPNTSYTLNFSNADSFQFNSRRYGHDIKRAVITYEV